MTKSKGIMKKTKLAPIPFEKGLLFRPYGTGHFQKSNTNNKFGGRRLRAKQVIN